MFKAIKEFFINKFKKEEAKSEAPYKLETPDTTSKKPAKPKKPRARKPQ